MDAALLTVIGAAIRGELRLLLGIPVTAAACAVAWRAARAQRAGARDLTVPYTLLIAAAAIGIFVPLARAPWWYLALFRAYPAAGLLTIAIARGGRPHMRRRAIIVLAVAGSVLAVLAPFALPEPPIDLWYWIEATTSALMHGTHPYTVTGIDPSHGAWDYGSTPTVFPYMPAVILFSAPAFALLGDYRPALALWLPISVLLLRAAARRFRVDDELADVATLAILLNPRALLVTINGQTDLYMLPVAALVLWSAARGWTVVEACAFMMLPALKQYAAAPAVIYMMIRRHWGAIAAGVGVAALTVVPFLAWNRDATLAGILYLVRAPIGFRADSDSLTALAYALTGWQSPRSLGITSQFVAGAIAGWMLKDRGVGGVLLASGISLLTCFLLATQAFVNYYAFVGALLVYASIALAARAEVA